MKLDRLRLKMSLSIPVIILLFMIAFFSGCEAGEKKLLWETDSPSKISVYPDSATLSNHSFLYANCEGLRHGDSGRYVVSQNTLWRVGPWEGKDPSVNATAFLIHKDGKREKIWNISEQADEGHLSCAYYHTVSYGCCGAGDNHRLYNPKTGRLIMEYSNQLLEIEIPGSPLGRYIGYKPSETIFRHDWEKGTRHIGTLTYSSPYKILQRIDFRMIGDNSGKFGFGHADISILPGGKDQKLKNDTLELWKAKGSTNPKDFTGFSIKIDFIVGYTIIVPIKDDRPYFEKAGSQIYEVDIVNE